MFDQQQQAEWRFKLKSIRLEVSLCYTSTVEFMNDLTKRKLNYTISILKYG